MKKFTKTVTKPQTLLIIGVVLLVLSYLFIDLATQYERLLQIVGILFIIAGIIFASARFNNKVN